MHCKQHSMLILVLVHACKVDAIAHVCVFGGLNWPLKRFYYF